MNYEFISIRGIRVLDQYRPQQTQYFYIKYNYIDNQRTVEMEDDMKTIWKCILCCYKKIALLVSKLNNLLNELGLFTLHNCLAYCSFLEYKCRLPISELFCNHCIWKEECYQSINPLKKVNALPADIISDSNSFLGSLGVNTWVLIH